MVRVPGNRWNDRLGHALGRLSTRWGGREGRALPEGRFVVYEDCAGPVGRFIRILNGNRDAALTLGGVVLFTRAFDSTRSSDRWLIAHEGAHTAQARSLGLLYLPLYVLGLLPAAAFWLLHRRAGRRRSLHDLHPMERAADRVADAAVPEAARTL